VARVGCRCRLVGKQDKGWQKEGLAVVGASQVLHREEICTYFRTIKSCLP
jgi:hypothetical protein